MSDNHQYGKNIVNLRPVDRRLSSVSDELDAIMRELHRIAPAVAAVEQHNSLCNPYEIDDIKRRVNAIAMRVHRAEQCSRGMRVYKPT